MKVAVIEDDLAVGWWVNYALRADGIDTVLLSKHFETALTEDFWDDIDVAVLDLMLNGPIQGSDILKWLGERRPHIRRIVLTASPWKVTDADVVVLRKPTPPSQLVAAIRDGGDGGRTA